MLTVDHPRIQHRQLGRELEPFVGAAEPERERPFRVPLYPFTPELFNLLAVMMVASSIFHEPMVALYSAITITVVWALKPVLAQKNPPSAD